MHPTLKNGKEINFLLLGVRERALPTEVDQKKIPYYFVTQYMMTGIPRTLQNALRIIQVTVSKGLK